MTSHETTSADGWFAIRPIDATTYCLTEALGDSHQSFGPITTHSYMVIGQRRAAVIDAGFGIGDLRAALRELTDLPIELCITHGHWDHYGSAYQFDRISVGVADADAIASPTSAQMQAMVDGVPARCKRSTPPGFSFANWNGPRTVRAGRLLADGDTVDLGGRVLTALATPGHSPGSTCYFDEENSLLFTGDTVFRGDMHVELEGSDEAAFARSVARLSRLQGYAAICPAHYETPLPAEFVTAVAERSRSWAGGSPVAAAAHPDFEIVRFAR